MIDPLWKIVLRRAVTNTRPLRTRLARYIAPEHATAADRMRVHLDQMNSDLFEKRYENDGPCMGCYQSVLDYDEVLS